MRSRRWFRLPMTVVAATAAVAGMAVPAVALSGSTAPEAAGIAARGPLVRDSATQPVYSMDDAVQETVSIETTVDTDNDGRRDRVHAHIVRPGETETGELRVPVILEESPYFFGVNPVENHNVDVPRLPQEDLKHPGVWAARSNPAPRTARPPTLDDLGARTMAAAEEDKGLPGWMDDYFVPRGYAVMWGESIGSGHSEGCPTIGDRAETLGAKAVIDWLNGRAKAWTDDGQPVVADWTNGDTGMVGVSYNGTLPNMVATTGVEGLKTIVPIAAISSWYDYYRANGLVVAPGGYQGEDADVLAEFTVADQEDCADEIAALESKQDRKTGDYTRFWHERDYVHRARSVDASVWVIHGLNDWNVKTQQFAQWWEQLERHRVPRKMWLHQGGHGGTEHDGQFVPTLHRWFDHWLYGLDTGVMDEPMVDVEREDGSWATYPDWPDPAVVPAGLHLVAESREGSGALSPRPARPGYQPKQSFVDRGRELTDTDLVADPDQANPNRLAYLTSALDEDVRMSGTPKVSLRASVDNRRAANLTALLVDYGPSGQEPEIVTRGWMDPQNRYSASRGKPLQPGKFYRFRWNMQPDDYVFPAGHRIGVVIISTDYDYTLRPRPGTRLTLDPGHSGIMLPVVGRGATPR